MSKDTPSMAKNKIRRSLVAILDPHPTGAEIEKLWAYFGSTCAYCGVSIQRGSRTGHLDHVLSSAQSGCNDVHNHVLSCARCNGDEKRDQAWQDFLARKSQSAAINTARREKIEAWLAMAPACAISADADEKLHQLIGEVIAHYDEAVAQLRALRDINATV